MRRKFFISYIHEEERLAEYLRDTLTHVFYEYAEFFLSSGGIMAGEDWLKRLKEEIQTGDSILVLLSPESVRRPWVNIEIGAFWANDRNILPLCHAGLKAGDLERPVSDHQATHLYDVSSVKSLIGVISNRCEMNAPPVFDIDRFCMKVREIDRTSSRTIEEWRQVLEAVGVEAVAETPLDLEECKISNESILTNTKIYRGGLMEVGGYVKDGALISIKSRGEGPDFGFLVIKVENSAASISDDDEKLMKVKVNDDVILPFLRSHRHYADEEYVYKGDGFFIYDLRGTPLDEQEIDVQLVFWKIRIDRLRLRFHWI